LNGRGLPTATRWRNSTLLLAPEVSTENRNLVW